MLVQILFFSKCKFLLINTSKHEQLKGIMLQPLNTWHQDANMQSKPVIIIIRSACGLKLSS